MQGGMHPLGTSVWGCFKGNLPAPWGSFHPPVLPLPSTFHPFATLLRSFPPSLAQAGLVCWTSTDGR